MYEKTYIQLFLYIVSVRFNMNKSKRSVLFLCTGNSARSQMAEALLKHKAGDQFDIFSAGTQPENVDGRAIAALKQFGIDPPQLVSKGIDTFVGREFDFVITLCDKASSECRDFPDAKQQYAWDFPDPKNRLGNAPFTVTLNELSRRLSMFLIMEGASVEEKVSNNTELSETEEKTLRLTPIDFYKNLTDEIRMKVLMLSHYHGELCVCEIMEALAEDSQPKVSRNLALLRKSNILSARKHGQWVFYRINPELPHWAKAVIAETTENNTHLFQDANLRLTKMQSRPNKATFCK